MCVCVYLSREVEGGGLWNRAVHLPEHLAQLRHHGGEVVEQRLDGLFEDGAHRLEEDTRSQRVIVVVVLDLPELTASCGSGRRTNSPPPPESR